MLLSGLLFPNELSVFRFMIYGIDSCLECEVLLCTHMDEVYVLCVVSGGTEWTSWLGLGPRWFPDGARRHFSLYRRIPSSRTASLSSLAASSIALLL